MHQRLTGVGSRGRRGLSLAGRRMALPLRTWARRAASLGRARLAHLPAAPSPALRLNMTPTWARRWGPGGDVARRWGSGTSGGTRAGRDPVDEINEEVGSLLVPGFPTHPHRVKRFARVWACSRVTCQSSSLTAHLCHCLSTATRSGVAPLQDLGGVRVV